MTRPAEPRRAVAATATCRWLARWGLYAPAAALGAVYAAFALIRHARFETAGFDLGIFDQAVRAYAHLQPPVVPIKGPGFDLLGDHFHPILVTLTPLYWAWPDARALLVAQAALIAVSVVPIGRLAVARLGPYRGMAVTLAYGLSWGVQGALAFDFHEVAFAVPLLACALAALAEERWRAALAWTLPLLAVKEDMGLVVAAVGGYLLLRRQPRLGAPLVALGVAATTLTTLVVIPALNPQGRYRYFAALGGSAGTDPWRLLGHLPAALTAQPAGKLALLVAVFGVTALAALRSPLVLIAVPTLAYRLAADNPLYWSTGPVHYNAPLMPIVFVALVAAVGALEKSPRRLLRGYARLAVPATVVIALVSVHHFSFKGLLDPAFYRPDPHAAAARRVLRLIPDGAAVAAGNHLAPHLTDRCAVVLFPNIYHAPVEWVVVDATRPDERPLPADQQRAALAALPSQGFRVVARDDGVVLFRSA